MVSTGVSPLHPPGGDDALRGAFLPVVDRAAPFAGPDVRRPSSSRVPAVGAEPAAPVPAVNPVQGPTVELGLPGPCSGQPRPTGIADGSGDLAVAPQPGDVRVKSRHVRVVEARAHDLPVPEGDLSASLRARAAPRRMPRLLPLRPPRPAQPGLQGTRVADRGGARPGATIHGHSGERGRTEVDPGLLRDAGQRLGLALDHERHAEPTTRTSGDRHRAGFGWKGTGPAHAHVAELRRGQRPVGTESTPVARGPGRPAGVLLGLEPRFPRAYALAPTHLVEEVAVRPVAVANRLDQGISADLGRPLAWNSPPGQDDHLGLDRHVEHPSTTTPKRPPHADRVGEHHATASAPPRQRFTPSRGRLDAMAVAGTQGTDHNEMHRQERKPRPRREVLK